MDAKLAEALTALCTELTGILRQAKVVDEPATPPPASSKPEVPSHSPIDDMPEWLTVDEFAATLRIGRSMAYELVRREKLPVRRFGRLVRIHRDALRLNVPTSSGPGRPGTRR